MSSSPSLPLPTLDVQSSQVIPAADWKPAPGEFLLGVTGHRDPVAADLPILEGVVTELLTNIRAKIAENGARLVVACHLAEGADQICAQAAYRLGIPLVIPLPMEQTDYEIDFSDGAPLQEFRRILSLARDVILLPTSSACPEAATAQDRRNQQYVEAGQFLSIHCPLLLALWDGRFNNKPGGTGDVVSNHLTMQRPSGMPGVVYHLLTPRASNPEPLEAEPYTLRVMTA
ncbi:MAG: hypothetical protein ACAI35_06370 [Candidatus Methylacidiphilales bacterium]|nr:hypothetical protein [Candidatus Methylacidiphilales bacterium]